MIETAPMSQRFNIDYYYALSLQDIKNPLPALHNLRINLECEGHDVRTIRSLRPLPNQIALLEETGTFSILLPGVWIPESYRSWTIVKKGSKRRVVELQVNRIRIKPFSEVTSADLLAVGYNEDLFNQVDAKRLKPFKPVSLIDFELYQNP